jgi:nitrite reductase/ring-hydroxylating ferredoxin subunit/uncharacterized membrane protein
VRSARNSNPDDARAFDALYAANWLEDVVERVEQSTVLEPAAEALQRAVAQRIPNGRVKDLLSGTWLGHPAHPMFTDLPIGFWTSAFVLDLVGGRRSRAASELLVLFGVVSAVPTAATGLADWSDTNGRARRVGLVHALANSSALALYTWSWSARRRHRHGRGVALGLLGATAATIGGYLGSHLLSRLGIGVDASARDAGPEDWTVAAALDAVGDEPVAAEVGGAPIVLVRRHGHVLALSGACPHRGGPIAEGTYDEDTVTCPWHGSCFALRDGALLRGPASMPLTSYDTRIMGGRIEIRRHTS